MKPETQTDIIEIYHESRLPAPIIQRIVDILDNLSERYAGMVEFRTRNDKHEILHSGSKKYFTFAKLDGKKKPKVIFAGAMEKGPGGVLCPAIRVRAGNGKLFNIPDKYKFPFEGERKPGWTNIILSEMTVLLLEEILTSEIDEYFGALERISI